VLSYRSTVADTLLSVATAYDDVLGAAMQINVRTDAVTFLSGYLHDTTMKFKAGTAPEFDVLRETAEVGNAEADRVRAVGDHRIAKQRLVELLGYDLSPAVSDDLALELTTPLIARPYSQSLSTALSQARQNRTEVLALEKEERLRDEGIITARAGYKPSVQAFAGYELTSQVNSRNAGDELHGGLVGVRLSWAVFDGFLTKGRVVEAVARRGKAAKRRQKPRAKSSCKYARRGRTCAPRALFSTRRSTTCAQRSVRSRLHRLAAMKVPARSSTSWTRRARSHRHAANMSTRCGITRSPAPGFSARLALISKRGEFVMSFGHNSSLSLSSARCSSVSRCSAFARLSGKWRESTGHCRGPENPS
jgi:outer membrane protein TolC